MMMVVMPALAVATAHTFVLTVSHDLLFRQPLDLTQWQVCRCFLSSFSFRSLPVFSSRFSVESKFH
jgi:hypothetical protein